MLRAALIAVCLTCSGCSYLFVQREPANHEQLRSFDCTSSRLAPIVDVGGAIEGVGTAATIELFANMGGEGGSSHRVDRKSVV